MAQSQLEIQFRCSVCDSVLIIHSINMSDDGCYSFIEPCEKCCLPIQRALDDGEAGHFLDMNSDTYKRWLELRKKTNRHLSKGVK